MDTPPEPLPVQEQRITQSLINCGLKAESFTVRYEDYLQGIEVVISPAAGVLPDQFPCINEATFPEVVTFADRAMFEHYSAFAAELYRPQILADVEVELKKLGLWDGFPERGSFNTLVDYVRALEVHSGFAPGTMARVDGEARVTFDPPREGAPTLSRPEPLGPLLAVLLYASARDGFDLAFIGNDKIAE